MGKWYLITSDNFDNTIIEAAPISNLDYTQVFISASDNYSGPYIEVYDDLSDVYEWIHNPNTDEEKNWNALYENPNDDPYSIDGPFPEEMDETTI